MRNKSHYGWEKKGINDKYIYFDFDGYTQYGRKRTLIPAICIWLDNYVFRTNTGYAMFVILFSFTVESTFERVVDWYWERTNRGRLFSVQVLDRFPPESDDDDDEDDDDDDY